MTFESMGLLLHTVHRWWEFRDEFRIRTSLLCTTSMTWALSLDQGMLFHPQEKQQNMRAPSRILTSKRPWIQQEMHSHDQYPADQARRVRSRTY